MKSLDPGFYEAKWIALTLAIVMLAGTLLTYAELDYVIIGNTGQVSATEVTARSGSATDIQAAVNSVKAAGGGIVHVPPGTFQWNGETVNSVGGVRIIGAGSTSTILHNNRAAPFNPMFVVDGTNGKYCRISGIRFEGNVTSSNDNVEGMAIELRRCMDFRIDHCTFIDFPNMAVGVTSTEIGTTRGVIDHNLIDNPYKDVFGSPPTSWGYGVIVQGRANTWHSNLTDFLGKYETAPSGFPIVYLEDNTFSRCRHAIASNQGAWYVARHNIIGNERPPNFGSVDVHGSASDTAPGGRGLEAYDNTIVGSAGYDYAQAFWIRGGGGVIFNNTMQNIYQGVGLFREVVASAQVRGLYIWGNTMDGGTLINNAGSYVENADYFLYSMPNYTPYPYPHPLTTR